VRCPKNSAKQPKQSPSRSLKMPPQEEGLGLPCEAPSVLHFVQLIKGGTQITYMIEGALGGWISILNSLRKEKSLWNYLRLCLCDYQLLNMASFLANQIVFMRLINAAIVTILHREKQFLS